MSPNSGFILQSQCSRNKCWLERKGCFIQDDGNLGIKQICVLNPNSKILLKGRRSQDGGGIGWGDHFLSYKFIKRITERRANFTKQLLIASWGHQAPRKATHCLRKEVGQNIKDKKRDKRAKDGDLSREGSLALAGLGEVFESRRATWLGGEQ